MYEEHMFSIIKIFLSIILMVVSLSILTNVVLPTMRDIMEDEPVQELAYVPPSSYETEATSVPTRAPTSTPIPTTAPSIYIAGDVNTGDKYDITNESQRIDYSMTIIIVAAIIIVPTFIVVMTVLILKHKKAEREHTEKVLHANLKTFEEQKLDELKEKYN